MYKPAPEPEYTLDGAVQRATQPIIKHAIGALAKCLLSLARCRGWSPIDGDSVN